MNVEIRRNPDGSIDEVLLCDGDICYFHMEQMDKGSWYFGLYPDPTGEDLGEEDQQFEVYRKGKRVIVRKYTDA